MNQPICELHGKKNKIKEHMLVKLIFFLIQSPKSISKNILDRNKIWRKYYIFKNYFLTGKR